MKSISDRELAVYIACLKSFIKDCGGEISDEGVAKLATLLLSAQGYE